MDKEKFLDWNKVDFSDESDEEDAGQIKSRKQCQRDEKA
jgi:hypothetical protein